MTDGHDIPEVIEGKLLAHRRTLAALVAAALDDGGTARERLRRTVDRDATDASHAEDPGVLPDAAFAIVASMNEELRLIAEKVAEIQSAEAKG